MPAALTAYRLAGTALAPFAGVWLSLRARRGKEDGARLGERLGRASLVRPEGPLVWLHGASVGEAGVLLSVRDSLAARRPDHSFLITTGTRTSAELIAAAGRARTLHQFAILDTPAAARRFLDHWRPDLGVFAESEVWPNLLLEASRRAIPLALVNASMGAASLANWARAPETARRVFSAFAQILAADRATAAGLERLIHAPVACVGNLKLAAAPPAPDAAELAAWRGRLAGRRVWIAASTHAGEEEIALAAHAALRRRLPDALLVLAPRHPERGASLAALAADAPRRALKQAPGAADAVFVADTLGELGLFFALAPVALMGGSLLPPLEGHNPVEPTLAGAAVLAGPYVSSFADMYGALDAAGGVRRVKDSGELAAAIEALWADEPARAAQVAAARKTLTDSAAALSQTIERLLALLARQHTHAAA